MGVNDRMVDILGFKRLRRGRCRCLKRRAGREVRLQNIEMGAQRRRSRSWKRWIFSSPIDGECCNGGWWGGADGRMGGQANQRVDRPPWRTRLISSKVKILTTPFFTSTSTSAIHLDDDNKFHNPHRMKNSQFSPSHQTQSPCYFPPSFHVTSPSQIRLSVALQCMRI